MLYRVREKTRSPFFPTPNYMSKYLKILEKTVMRSKTKLSKKRIKPILNASVDKFGILFGLMFLINAIKNNFDIHTQKR